tara:strand:- start:330 stop:908 length:579 start_codon:yes stop_codon:yes gene_type:complete
MCGRFTLRNVKEIKSQFNLKFDVTPNFNIVPSNETLVLTKEFNLMSWGYSPAWAKSRFNIINARSETLNQKPSFSSARRCLVLADGWYEWGTNDSGKVPYFFHRGGELLYFEGIYNQDQGKPRFAIVTTQASKNIQTIHNRMPLVVEKTQLDQWMDSQKTFFPKKQQRFRFHRVSKIVNSPRNNNESCVKPV